MLFLIALIGFAAADWEGDCNVDRLTKCFDAYTGCSTVCEEGPDLDAQCAELCGSASLTNCECIFGKENPLFSARCKDTTFDTTFGETGYTNYRSDAEKCKCSKDLFECAAMDFSTSCKEMPVYHELAMALSTYSRGACDGADYSAPTALSEPYDESPSYYEEGGWPSAPSYPAPSSWDDDHSPAPGGTYDDSEFALHTLAACMANYTRELQNLMSHSPENYCVPMSEYVNCTAAIESPLVAQARHSMYQACENLGCFACGKAHSNLNEKLSDVYEILDECKEGAFVRIGVETNRIPTTEFRRDVAFVLNLMPGTMRDVEVFSTDDYSSHVMLFTTPKTCEHSSFLTKQLGGPSTNGIGVSDVKVFERNEDYQFRQGSKNLEASASSVAIGLTSVASVMATQL